MAIVTVKNKYQVVIPQSVRDKVAVNVGDLFEAAVEKGKITFTPKSLVDRRIAEGLEDIKKGREYGPYGSVPAAMAAFGKRTAKAAKRAKRRVAP
jgi:bifunctional DNA-binding transcriptional regulator/antitoxin component of YhaV-PrlF toxin-antitoxin module